MQPAIINFSYNWNNKLDCLAFTTIRLQQPNKYIVGKTYQVQLKGQYHCWVKILDIKAFKLPHLNEFMARIDTGYDKLECANIIRQMYPKCDWNTQLLSFILLVKVPAPDQSLFSN